MGRFSKVVNQKKLSPNWEERGYKHKLWRGASPSQIEEYELCPRKWHLNKIKRVKQEYTEKQEQVFDWGDGAHEQYEFILLGEDWEPIEKQAHASAAHPWLIQLRDEGRVISVEESVFVPTAVDPCIAIWGRQDVGIDTGVVDHKTTSGYEDENGNKKYCWTSESLRKKRQTIIYAQDFLIKNPDKDEVEIIINYVQRPGKLGKHNYNHKRPPENWQVSAVMTREEVEKEILEVDRILEEMYALSYVVNPFEVPDKAPKACHAYGGCAYREHCESVPPENRWSEVDKVSANKENDIMAKLKRSKKNLTPKTESESAPKSTPKVKKPAAKPTLETLKHMFSENMTGLDEALAAAEHKVKMQFSIWRAAEIGKDVVPPDVRPDHEPGARLDDKTGDEITEVQALKITPTMKKALEAQGCATLQDVVKKCTEEQLLSVKGIGQGAVDKLKEELAKEGLSMGGSSGKEAIDMSLQEQTLAFAKENLADKGRWPSDKPSPNLWDSALGLNTAIELTGTAIELAGDANGKVTYKTLRLAATIQPKPYESATAELVAEINGPLSFCAEKMISDLGDVLEKLAAEF